MKYKNKEWLKRKYFDEKKTFKEIAEECGCSENIIYGNFKKHGLKSRNREGRIQRNITKDFLKKRYIDERLSTYKIAKEFNCSGYTISHYLKRFGIKIRDSKGENNGMFGRHHSKEHKQYLSEINTGKNNGFYGKKHSEKTRDVLSEKSTERFKDKTKHPRYVDGRSRYPYPVYWTPEFKKKILERDEYTCQRCNEPWNEITRRPHVHHIDYNKDNLDEKNLLTLCNGCNSSVNVGREDWTQVFQLYQEVRCLR